jgi:hypothetical protein
MRLIAVSAPWGPSFGSGLPFEYTGKESEALARDGREVVDHLKLALGRTLPALSINATGTTEFYKTDVSPFVRKVTEPLERPSPR